jgi:anti-sigma B factor antagonist
MTEQVVSSTRELSDGLLVAVAGDINYARAPQLRAQLMQLLATPRPRLVVDLAAVDYMDSSGVATLVEAMQVQRKAGHKMVLCRLSAKVRGIFEIARLDTVFTLVDDVAAAERA